MRRAIRDAWCFTVAVRAEAATWPAAEVRADADDGANARATVISAATARARAIPDHLRRS
jgi:hypothetical protein